MKAVNFEFTSYDFNLQERRAIFNYKTEFKGKDPILWTEVIALPEITNLQNIPKQQLEKILQSLHIILGISYWKFYCATNIKLNYQLTNKEAEFWNTVYQKGLGEFFYKNNLDPKISPQFPYDKKNNLNYTDQAENNINKNNNYVAKCLVAVGGGKDSIVSAESLKQSNVNFDTFFIETNGKSELIDKVANIIGKKFIKIKRTLDPKVSDKHLYNGHIPISAIYGFLGIFYSILNGYKYFIVSNEHSSNFGNLEYKGLEVNHQWSKSKEFEQMLQNYVKEFVKSDVIYFSLLRSFFEIRITEKFANYKKYFPFFSSCNKNFSKDNNSNKLWCGQCPKCLFAFLLLSAFLGKKELIKIFKKNLYQEKSLLPLFSDILGLGKMKPFDCVGTFTEAKAAMYLAEKRFKSDFIVKNLFSKLKITKDQVKEVFKTNDSLSPLQFKFIATENVLILGYGKEGIASRKYIEHKYSKVKIGIADEKQDKNYLSKQNNFDFAIKTPGINKKYLSIPYTTGTNIFFSEIKGKNTIIGVTGSKGKSTTATLIYEILKTAGKNVKFLGNIGKPMLEVLLMPISSDTIFVLEMSSYQLDDITFSPDISVVTNLFPEHMDFHGSLENYFAAKKNIINFQNKNNYFIYNKNNKLMTSWLKDYSGKAIEFAKNIPLSDSEIPLLGEHNRDNIKAAVSVAKIFNISDEVICTAVKSFKGLEHRLEFVGEFSGIKFYNDAISTTPESTIMAIKAIENIDTIFLGGQDRGYDFSELTKLIAKSKIKNVVLFPDSGKKIIKGIANLNILETKSMRQAVEFAFKYTKANKVCLLSCASPSYSVWKNFEEKGKQFKEEIIKFSKK